MELNKIYNEDCVVGMQKMIESGIKVDLIITDPPYLSTNGTTSGEGLASRVPKNRIDWVCNDFDYENVFNLMIQLQNTVNMFIFCSNRQISRTMAFFEGKGYSVTLLIWQKTNPIPLGQNNHISDCEFVVYVRGQGAYFDNAVPMEWKKKIYTSGVVSNKERIHPTQKSVDHIRQYIEMHSRENALVFDPFMGSGTTAIACIRSHRKFIGFEIDDKYYKLANDRINKEMSQLTLF